MTSLDVQSAPRTQKLSFSNGVTYQLHEISALDYRDLLASEHKIEGPEGERTFEGAMFFCWLAVRERKQDGVFTPSFDDFLSTIPFQEAMAKAQEVIEFVNVPFTDTPKDTLTD